MNRLQKKCAIATASFHLLLLVIIFVGPAFFWAHEKPDTSPVLDMIPANLVDTASTGVQNPPPPAPTPIVTPPQTPTPPAPQPVVQPTPEPTIAEKLEKFFKPEPVKPTPTEIQPPTPKVNLHLVTRTVPNNNSTPNKTTPDNTKAIKSALTVLRNNLSHATEIAPVGNSSVASANYAQVVKSIYEQAWILPDNMDSDAANTKVRVTISSDGTVVSAKIITPSGDPKLDTSVQRTLERVTFIGAFPPGSTDTERTYIINFNPQIKRMLG
jgi:TonB family protein